MTAVRVCVSCTTWRPPAWTASPLEAEMDTDIEWYPFSERWEEEKEEEEEEEKEGKV